MHVGSNSRRISDPPWISFADALSAMLFVFMLTTVWAMGKMRDETEEVIASIPTPASTENLVRTQLIALQGCISNAGDNLSVYPDMEDHSLAILVTPLWFGTCSTDVSDAGGAAISAMRSCVQNVIANERLTTGEMLVDRYDMEVVFEGHTDATPVGRNCPFPSNWELSGARASLVLRRFRCSEGAGCNDTDIAKANEINSAVERVGEEHIRFSAVGMAETRPTWSAICATLGDALCPQDHGRFPLHGRALTTWANEVGGHAAIDRQNLLRRVDLRVDLRPRAELMAALTVKP